MRSPASIRRSAPSKSGRWPKRARPAGDGAASQQPACEHGPDRLRQPAPIVTRDVVAPQLAGHELRPAAGISPISSGALCSSAYRASVAAEGRLVLTMTTSIGRPIVRASSSHGVAGSEAGHPASFGEQIRDEDDRSLHPADGLRRPLHQEDRHQAGVEAARPDDGRLELRIAASVAGCMRTSGSSHNRVTAGPPFCPASTSTSPRVRVPS